MKLIKNNQIISDEWQILREPILPLDENFYIVPFPFWQEHKEELAPLKDKVAFFLNGDDETATASKYINDVAFIALDFPAFADGRSYSHARLLRDRYNYKGELRAIGDVLRDQLFYMLRCGFDTFALRDDKDAEDALKAFREFTIRYQTAADGAEPIHLARHH